MCEVDRRKFVLHNEFDIKVEDMSKVLDASAFGCLMYVMVCTKLDLAHAVNTTRRYMANRVKSIGI